jgi:hypothetical protein
VAGVDGHVAARQRLHEGHLVLERRDDRLELLPLVEQRVGVAQEHLDVLGLLTVGRDLVHLERELALLEAEELEEHLLRGGVRDRTVRGRRHDGAVTEPDAALATVAVDVQAAGLRRGGEQPQNVR